MCIRDRASSDEGHTFLPENILHQRAMEILEIGDVDEIKNCLLYTSDAADDLLCVDLGGRRIIKKKKHE